jgi:hypothetical protein
MKETLQKARSFAERMRGGWTGIPQTSAQNPDPVIGEDGKPVVAVTNRERLGNKRPAKNVPGEVPGTNGQFGSGPEIRQAQSVTGYRGDDPLVMPSGLDPAETGGSPSKQYNALPVPGVASGGGHGGDIAAFLNASSSAAGKGSGSLVSNKFQIFPRKQLIMTEKEQTGNGRHGSEIPLNHVKAIKMAIEQLGGVKAKLERDLKIDVNRPSLSHATLNANRSAKETLTDLFSHIYLSAQNPHGSNAVASSPGLQFAKPLKDDDSPEEIGRLLSVLHQEGRDYPETHKVVPLLRELVHHRMNEMDEHGEITSPASPISEHVKGLAEARRAEKIDAAARERDASVKETIGNARKLTGEDRRAAGQSLRSFGIRDYAGGSSNAVAHIEALHNEAPVPMPVLRAFLSPMDQKIFNHIDRKIFEEKYSMDPGLATIYSNLKDKAKSRFHDSIGHMVTDHVSRIPGVDPIPKIKAQLLDNPYLGEKFKTPEGINKLVNGIIQKATILKDQPRTSLMVPLADMHQELRTARTRGIDPRNLPLDKYFRLLSDSRPNGITPHEASKIIGASLGFSSQAAFEALGEEIDAKVNPNHQSRYLDNIPIEMFAGHVQNITNSREPLARTKAVQQAASAFVDAIPSSDRLDLKKLEGLLSSSLTQHARLSPEELPIINQAIKKRWPHGPRSENASEAINGGPIDKKTPNVEFSGEEFSRHKGRYVNVVRRIKSLGRQIKKLSAPSNGLSSGATGSVGMTQGKPDLSSFSSTAATKPSGNEQEIKQLQQQQNELIDSLGTINSRMVHGMPATYTSAEKKRALNDPRPNKGYSVFGDESLASEGDVKTNIKQALTDGNYDGAAARWADQFDADDVSLVSEKKPYVAATKLKHLLSEQDIQRIVYKSPAVASEFLTERLSEPQRWHVAGMVPEYARKFDPKIMARRQGVTPDATGAHDAVRRAKGIAEKWRYGVYDGTTGEVATDIPGGPGKTGKGRILTDAATEDRSLSREDIGTYQAERAASNEEYNARRAVQQKNADIQNKRNRTLRNAKKHVNQIKEAQAREAAYNKGR